MLAACLLTALAALADDPAAAGDAVDRPLVLRFHSLAGLVETTGRADGALALLPYRVSTSSLPWEVGDEVGACTLHAEDVVALVRESVEPALWDEAPGVRLDLRGGDRLLAVAPQEVQDEIADFLSHLIGAVVPSEKLEVRVVYAAETDVAAGELWLDAADADRRIAERGLLRHAVASLRGRVVVRADDVDRETIVYDYEDEIAQGATIADPVVVTVDTGLELLARATRVEGGEMVNLVVRAAEPAAPTVERRMAAHSLVNAKPVMAERPAVGILQHPQIAFASFAGTVYLPEGKAVWIPVTIATHLGSTSFCLDLRVTGRLVPYRSSFEPPNQPAGESMRFDLVGRGAADLGNVETERLRPDLFDDFWTDDGSGPIWARLPVVDDDGFLVELAQTVAAEAFESGHGSVGYAGGMLRTWLPRTFADRIAAALAPAQRFDAGVVVRGRILAGDEERGRFRVPAVLGRPLSLWSGAQGTRIVDWDVDVANEAQACNPRPEAWVDGVALRLVLSRNAAGEFVLDANGKLCVFGGPPQPVDLQDDSRLTIDRIRARTLFFDDLRTLPAQGGKLRFGGGLALELEVLPAGR